MANDSLRVWDVIPAKPEEIYFAWLDSDAHAAMTGGAAEIADGVGSRFTAWDGYIEGTTLHLEPGRRRHPALLFRPLYSDRDEKGQGSLARRTDWVGSIEVCDSRSGSCSYFCQVTFIVGNEHDHVP
jgi:hypothetical protein